MLSQRKRKIYPAGKKGAKAKCLVLKDEASRQVANKRFSSRFSELTQKMLDGALKKVVIVLKKKVFK